MVFNASADCSVSDILAYPAGRLMGAHERTRVGREKADPNFGEAGKVGPRPRPPGTQGTSFLGSPASKRLEQHLGDCMA